MIVAVTGLDLLMAVLFLVALALPAGLLYAAHRWLGRADEWQTMGWRDGGWQ